MRKGGREKEKEREREREGDDLLRQACTSYMKILFLYTLEALAGSH